LPFKHFFNLRI